MKKTNVISLCLLVSMFALFTPFVETVNAAVTSDNVTVNASVGESISLVIAATAINFGTLVSSGPRFADTSSGSDTDVVAHTITLSTSAGSGYTVALSGGTLATSTYSIDPITAATSSHSGTEQFGIRLEETGSGAGLVNGEYDSATEFSLATSTPVAAATAASADVYSVHYLANISITTETGAYSTILTYTMTSNF